MLANTKIGIKERNEIKKIALWTLHRQDPASAIGPSKSTFSFLICFRTNYNSFRLYLFCCNRQHRKSHLFCPCFHDSSYRFGTGMRQTGPQVLWNEMCNKASTLSGRTTLNLHMLERLSDWNSLPTELHVRKQNFLT